MKAGNAAEQPQFSTPSRHGFGPKSLNLLLRNLFGDLPFHAANLPTRILPRAVERSSSSSRPAQPNSPVNFTVVIMWLLLLKGPM